MRKVKMLGIVVAILVILILLGGLVLPTSYSVERSITINATTQQIHRFVGDLTMWQTWIPWQEDDPTLIIYKGLKSQGVGASQSWRGDSGEGKLEITASSPEKGIRYNLYFDEATQKTDVSLRYSKQNSQTRISWTMTGNMDIPILGGYFVIMMDSMVGKMFERGLLRLKAVVEKKPLSRIEKFRSFTFPEAGEKLSLAEIKSICNHFGLDDLWQKIQTDPPTQGFSSDGCSMWMNEWKGISIYPACFLHDIKYWAGYPHEDLQRMKADADLMIDVAILLNSTSMAETMFNGVRVGGHERYKTAFSWGFGRQQ